MIRGFTAIHPFVLLMFYGLAMMWIMVDESLPFQFIIAILIVFMNILLDRGVQLRKWLRALFFIGIFIIIFTPIFNHMGRTILFYLFKWSITLDAVIYGCMLALTMINIMMLFVTINITLTNDKLLFLFGKIFPRWALLTMLSLRFVPLLRHRLQAISEVQQFKNGPSRRLSFKAKLENGMAQVQILLSGSLEEAIQTADSMDARGYGLGKRSHYHRYKMQLRDWITLAFFVSLFGLFLFSIYGIHEVDIVFGFLQVPHFHMIVQGLIYVMFFIPIFIEGKEVLKWRFYQSNM